jgi:hypothetical protein
MRSYNVLAALFISLLVDPITASPMVEKRDFTNETVFTTPSDYTSWKTIYGRSVQLTDGSLLVTWEDYPPEAVTPFPLYRSTDGGLTWSNYSQVLDQVNKWGMRYQPNLYVLPEAFGGYAAGTVLCVGVSAPYTLAEEYIDVYASTDLGLTWKFLSHIAYGMLDFHFVS